MAPSVTGANRHGSVVFEVLVDAIVDRTELRKAIDDLLRRKRQGEEMKLEPKIPVINDYIERELARLETARHDFVNPAADTEQLDRLFRRVIEEVWR